MSIIASQLIGSVSIQGVLQAAAQLKGVGAASDEAGNKLQKIAVGSAVLVGAALIGIGVQAVKMAANFQQGLTTLVTGAGESASNLKMIGDGILQIAVQTGTRTKQLTDGMFMIESAGYRGAIGLAVLKVAAEGAKVGAADLGTVSNALTTVLTDYYPKATSAAQATKQSADAMNFLVAIVQNGKTTMQDLAASMATILPTASAFHVKMLDVGAAMATMTGEGIPAANAATYLRQTISTLSAETGKGATALQAIGLTVGQVSADMKKSMPDTLQLIMDHLKETYTVGSPQYIDALKAIAGGQKQMQGVLALTGAHLQTFQDNMKNVADTMNQGKGAVVGWSTVQNDFNFKLDQGKAVLETLMIKIGSALLPVITALLDKVIPVIVAFSNWLTEGNKLQTAISILGTVFSTLGGFIGGVVAAGVGLFKFFQDNQVVAAALLIPLGILSAILVQMAVTAIVAFIATIPALVGGFIAWTVAAGAAAIATIAATWPILLIGAIIGLVVAGIILAVKNWGAIVAWLSGVWGAFSSWFGGIMSNIGTFFHKIWDGIQIFFKSVWDGIVNIAKIALAILIGVILGPFIAIGALFIWLYNHNTYVKQLVDTIINFFKAGLAWIQNAWNIVVQWLVGQWANLVTQATTLWNNISGAVQAGWSKAVGFISSIWNQISAFFANAWNTYIATPLTNLWNTISTFFANAWTRYIVSPLGNLWNQIRGWFGNLASQAWQWGVNLIQSFINGIGSMFSNLGTAVHNVASQVGNVLGFHSPPKEGPARDSDTWMPNMMAMFAEGIRAGAPSLHAALSTSVNAMISPVAYSPSLMGIPASTGNGRQDMHVHVYLDKKRLANDLLPEIVQGIRTATGVKF